MPALSHQDRLLLQQALCATPQLGTHRGRETLLQNTLGAYPHTVKALQWVNLEGNREEVAYDLVTKVEGLESSPGVSALALIAAAIQPLLPGEHRDKLAALRRRMQWTDTDSESLDADTWRDKRTDDELTLERVIGENTLRHLYYLRHALVVAESVVRIDINGRPAGTGFLVAPGIVMTCNHVIPDAREAQRASARFFEEQPDPTTTEPPRRAVIVKVSKMLYTNPKLDFTLLELATDADGAPLKLSAAPVKPNDRVPIIQHPEGMAKQISIQNNLVAYADADKVQYYTTTMPGSSGSPVFDNQFHVVAIHRKSVGQKHFPVAEDTAAAHHPYRNQGTSMIAILADLRNNDLLKLITP